jgi:hypothetical protein
VRVVDHVEQIRDTALEGLLDRTEVTDGQVCLPLLHAVSRRNHGLYALDMYWRALLNRHGVVVAVQLMDNSDLATRRDAYAACLEQHGLSLGRCAWNLIVHLHPVNESEHGGTFLWCQRLLVFAQHIGDLFEGEPKFVGVDELSDQSHVLAGEPVIQSDEKPVQ